MRPPSPEEKGQEEEAKVDDAKKDEEGAGQPNDGTLPRWAAKRGVKRRWNGEKVDQSKVVDIKSLPANPLQEVPFLKQPALLVKAFVGNNVYVANTGDKDVTISVGTFLHTVWLWQGEVLCQ